MPADKWTEVEMDTLLKALVSVQLPVQAKKAIAKEVRMQCLGVGYQQDVAHAILRKLGYENLNSEG